MKHLIPIALVAAVASIGVAVSAAGPTAFLSQFEAAARKADAGFVPNATRGAEFFKARHGGDWSCASCHTASPKSQGRHAGTAKLIQPLAPAANPERFTDEAKVEKWFRRNCADVLGRACRPAEKADVVAWLLSIR